MCIYIHIYIYTHTHILYMYMNIYIVCMSYVRRPCYVWGVRGSIQIMLQTAKQCKHQVIVESCIV